MNKFLLLIFLCLGLNTNGQTLHFLVFGDTEDPRIGIPTNMSCDYLKQLSDEIATNAELKENFMKFTGSDYTKANFLSTINNLNVGSQDVVFAYIISHGWNNMRNEYPMMVFGPKSLGIDNGSINLNEIYQSIIKKNPKLLIVIGEACNRERNVRPPAIKSKELVVHPPRFDIDAEQFKNLFRKSNKGILMCSSRRGQVSTSDVDKGGWFTQSFRETLEDFTSKKHKKPATWEELMETTKKATEKLAYDSGSEDPQSPVYEINNMPAKSPVIPKEDTQNNRPVAKQEKPIAPPVSLPTNEPKKASKNVNEPCNYNFSGFRINKERLAYLESYWKGLDGLSDEEASERFKESVYPENTRIFYKDIASFLEIEQYPARTKWFTSKGKEIIELFDETNEYVDTKDFKLKAMSKLSLVIEAMKDITRQLEDINRKCSE
ncbi:caspase family protein [Emticicia sp. 17c]|uniref:caspase family protein n=1 Tax=Emticicia sp. 17c TaxID=3127704 RepID=UPI00301B967C